MMLATLIIQAILAVGNRLYPLPESTDLNDAASVKAAIGALPAGAFLVLLVAWVTGAGVGAYVASQLSGRSKAWPGFAVGVLILGASVIYMLTLPHPIWIWAGAILFVPAATIAANRFAIRH